MESIQNNVGRDIIYFLREHDAILRELDIDEEKLLEIKPYYPTLIKAIISRRISVTAARRDITQLGHFYSVEDIERKDLSFLTESTRQVINDVNKFVKQNGLDKDNIRKLKYIRGIGDWTISVTLMANVYENPDIFPQVDVYINKKIMKLYGVNNKFEISEMINGWKPFRSYAFKMLWYSNN